MIRESMFNTVAELLILRNFGVQDRLGKYPKIMEVIWKPPPYSWVKVNTDSSAYGTPGPSGCSGAFRIHRGFMRGCFSIPLGVGYAFEAELATTIHTIEFAWNYGWKHFWLESDFSYVVSILLARSLKFPICWRPVWSRVLGLIANMSFTVTHIYREGNYIADLLISRAPSIVCPTWWWSAPSFISHVVYDDCIVKSSFRFC